MNTIHGALLIGCSALALAGCGADDIASPGAGGIVIENPTPAPTPAPTPTPGTVVAAASCPTFTATGGLTDSGVLPTAQGTWRVCTLPALVDKSSSLPKLAGVIYRMNGRVDVGCDGGFKAPTSAAPVVTSTVSCANRSLTADTDVTLTVDPGVIIYGENGAEPAWMAVNRGNKLNAVGTATQPVIFTSRANVVGTATDTDQGQWGGVVLLGRGIVTDCNIGSTTGGNCERDTEGSANPARFGGADNTYNAGSMKYVQIRYSGYSLAVGKELQSLTGGGTGTGTTFDYFQSVNSSDDGSEFFGGAVNFKHYIAVNADDDSLDLDTGVVANFQYGLILQRSANGDAFYEIDSNGNEDNAPRSKINIANFTAVQPAASSNNESNDLASILIRGNSDVTLVNNVLVSPANECIRLHGTSTNGSAAATLKAFATVLTCGGTGPFLGSGSYNPAATAAAFGTANGNSSTFTSTLTSTFVNGASESGVAGYADITTISSFFDKVSYIGAVSGASDVWYRGWTCDNATGNFGSNAACTTLPTT